MQQREDVILTQDQAKTLLRQDPVFLLGQEQRKIASKYWDRQFEEQLVVFSDFAMKLALNIVEEWKTKFSVTRPQQVAEFIEAFQQDVLENIANVRRSRMVFTPERAVMEHLTLENISFSCKRLVDGKLHAFWDEIFAEHYRNGISTYCYTEAQILEELQNLILRMQIISEENTKRLERLDKSWDYLKLDWCDFWYFSNPADDETPHIPAEEVE